MILLEDGKKKEEIYAMWQRNFHDPVPYARFYFDEVYGKNDILLNVQDDEDTIKGMLHLNPYGLSLGGQNVDAHYIVGVATDEEFRRQGVMRELLKETFSRLRSQGETFTYLMPADENYYLPFDFRFGSCQIEQEIECFSGSVPEAPETEYEYFTLKEINLEEVARMENRQKDAVFTIHTEITPEYLKRLEKETNSDFGKLFFVYSKGEYVGRFVMGAENDYMVISQIFYAKEDKHEWFLYEVLNYCEEHYHYGKYQLVLDESWKKILKKPGNYQGIRVLPFHSRPIIMFRILNVEKMGLYLKANNDSRGVIKITDQYLEEQNGIYEWSLSQKNCTIRKIEDESVENDCGEISIGDLTMLLFGRKKGESPDKIPGLTSKGRELLGEIIPMSLNCMQEIV